MNYEDSRRLVQGDMAEEELGQKLEAEAAQLEAAYRQPGLVSRAIRFAARMLIRSELMA